MGIGVILLFHSYINQPISLYIKYTLIQFCILFTCSILLTKFLLKVGILNIKNNHSSKYTNLYLVILFSILCTVIINSQFIRNTGHPFVWQAGLEGLAHHDILYRSAQASMFKNYQVLSVGAFGFTSDFGHRLSEILLGVFSFVTNIIPLKVYFLFQAQTLTAMMVLSLIIATRIVNKKTDIIVLIIGGSLTVILLLSFINYFLAVRMFNNLPQSLGIITFIFFFSLCIKLLSQKKLTNKQWIGYMFLLIFFSMIVIFSKIHLGYVASAVLCVTIIFSDVNIRCKIISLTLTSIILIAWGTFLLYPTLFYGIGLERKNHGLTINLFFAIIFFLLLTSFLIYLITKQKNRSIFYLCITLPVLIPPILFDISAEQSHFFTAIPIITVLYFASLLPEGVLSSDKFTNNWFFLFLNNKANAFIVILCLVLLGFHLYKYPTKNSIPYKNYITYSKIQKESLSLKIINNLKDKKNVALFFEFRENQYQKIGYSCRYPFLIYQAYLEKPVFFKNSMNHIKECYKISDYGIYPKFLKEKFTLNDICLTKEIYKFNRVIYINEKGQIIKKKNCPL